jgi:hypothetical protein
MTGYALKNWLQTSYEVLKHRTSEETSGDTRSFRLPWGIETAGPGKIDASTSSCFQTTYVELKQDPRPHFCKGRRLPVYLEELKIPTTTLNLKYSFGSDYLEELKRTLLRVQNTMPLEASRLPMRIETRREVEIDMWVWRFQIPWGIETLGRTVLVRSGKDSFQLPMRNWNRLNWNKPLHTASRLLWGIEHDSDAFQDSQKLASNYYENWKPWKKQGQIRYIASRLTLRYWNSQRG